MQALLDQLEHKLHRFSDPITLSDPAQNDCPFVMVNGAFGRLVGHSPSTLAGETMESLGSETNRRVTSSFHQFAMPDRSSSLLIGFHHDLDPVVRITTEDGENIEAPAARQRVRQIILRSRQNRWRTAFTILTVEVQRYARQQERAWTQASVYRGAPVARPAGWASQA